MANEIQNNEQLEQIENNKRKARHKKFVSYVVGGILVAAVAAGGMTYALSRSEAAEISTTYQVQAATNGEIKTSVTGSGKLTSEEITTVTMSGSGTVMAVNKNVGDRVVAGETIGTIKSSEVSDQLASLYSQLNTLNATISNTTKTASSKYMKSSVSGKVKSLQVEEGSDVASVMAEKGYLCLISTDGKMKVSIPAGELQKGTAVQVTVGEDAVDGTVTKVAGGQATVEIDTNTFDVGADVIVSGEAGELGSGSLELVNYIQVTGSEGSIASVLKAENASVYSGTSLFKLASYPESDTYAERIKEREALESQIRELERQLSISVDYNGIITALSISPGDTVSSGQAVAVISSTDGYTLPLTVDESDIATLKTGQKAVVTMDAVKGTFSGEVTKVSYEGTTDSAVTSYGVTVTTDGIDGAIPGMSASCVITTQTSDNTMIVPVEAVQSARGESYIYLAPSGNNLGDEIGDTEIDVNSLTKVKVETGMSDGMNVSVTGDINTGDLILVPKVTSTNTGTQTQSTNARGMGGSMTGGTPPEGFGGGNMQRGAQQ